MKLSLQLAKAIQPPPEIIITGVVGYDVLARALVIVPAMHGAPNGSSSCCNRSPVRLAGPPLRPLPEESFLQWHPLVMVCH